MTSRAFLCLALAALAALAGAELCLDATCGERVPLVEPCACTADNIGYSFTPCNDTTNKKTLVYYWRPPATCTASNVSLPAPVDFPCDTSCRNGQFLDVSKHTCSPCPAGTYSTGSSIQWRNFFMMPSQLSSTCESEITGDRCNPWQTTGRYLDSGDNSNLHKIQSILTSHLTFFVDGTVSFDYLVSSEPTWDGLKFVVDGTQLMFESGNVGNRTSPATFSCSVPAGFHTLQWIYSKDMSFEGGSDRAQIHRISITGASPFNLDCTKCAAGRYSNEGAQMCFACTEGTFSPEPGSRNCTRCPEGTNSTSGATECFSPRVCGRLDMYSYLTPCVGGNQKRIYAWLSNPSCDYRNVTLPAEETAACGGTKCYRGQYIAPDGKCTACPSGTYNPAEDDKTSCLSCSAGETGDARTVRYDVWNGTLPRGFSRSPTWRLGYDFIDSGSFLGLGASSELSYEATFDKTGAVEFTYDVLCQVTGNGTYLMFSVGGGFGPVTGGVTFPCQTDCGLQQRTYRADIPPGRQRIRWTYRADPVVSSMGNACDNARIYSMTFSGLTGADAAGGSTGCVACPAGTSGKLAGNCSMCPAGTFGRGGTAPCVFCDNNEFSEAGSGNCTACASGTTSDAGADVCRFDCSNLPLKTFTPVVADAPDNVAFSVYWIPTRYSLLNGSVVLSMCAKTNFSEVGEAGYMMIHHKGDTGSVEVATQVSFTRYLSNPTDGFVASFFSRTACSASILFICDPTEPITSMGTFRAGSSGSCGESFVWRSRQACRKCTAEDYRSEETPCTTGTNTISYRWITDRCSAGVSLPPQDSNHACSIINDDDWKMYAGIGIGVAAGVLIIVGLIVGGLMWYNRRLVYRYSKLLNTGESDG